jgi:phage terminase large subunit
VSENEILDIPATRNYFELKKAEAASARFVALEGSSGSGKTFSVISYLIEQMLQSPITVTTFRHDRATCQDSVLADFKRLMLEYYKLWDDRCWNGSEYSYKFPNGSLYQFRGANSPEKLHGPRRNIAHLNEVMEIGYDAYVQIAARTSGMIIADWNPSLSHHWMFDKVLTREDIAYVHSTFKDNHMLPDMARREIEKLEPTPENIKNGTADQWAWSVYGLGKRGRRQGVVFPMWDIVDEWPDPINCSRWGFGLDYGYSQDPTALVECCIYRDELWMREWLYEPELVAQSNPLDPGLGSIEGHLRVLGVPATSRIHADSARPEINAALRKSGFNVIAAKKGKGSILAGLDRLKSQPIRVYKTSQNLQAELQNYVWAKTGKGELTDKPIDKYNHLIDAARYWAAAELAPVRKKRKGKVSKLAKSALKIWR